VDIPPGKLR